MTPLPTPPPLPFAELLKRATKGPFHEVPGTRLISSNRTNLHIGTINRDHREYVIRLLNWSHAGGVDEVRRLLDRVKLVNKGVAEIVELIGLCHAVEDSLALLDGQREEK